jgi:hypothetical protein
LFLMEANTALAHGDTLWTRHFNRGGGCYARSLLVDQQDNIIVIGTRMGGGTGNDIGVAKYSSEGDLQWFAFIAGPGASDEEAKGAALGPDGDIYITASSGLYPDFDILTVELNGATGNEIWRRTWAGTGNKADVPAGIAVDAGGYAYVTGYTTAANNLTDWVTMKHLPGTGLPLWTVVRPGGDGMDYPTAIALGPGNAVYVTGYSAGQYMEDYCTVKYNTGGVEQWASFYNYSGNGPDIPVAIAVDDAGDAYVTGRSATQPPPGGLNQYATVKYANDSGAQMWVARYEGEDGNNAPVAVALGDDAVYVTGSSQGAGGDNDYGTISYDRNSGSQLWATRYNGPAGKADDAVDLAFMLDGTILVTGTSVDANDKGGFVTFCYTDSGEVDRSGRYDDQSGSDAAAVAVAFDSHCNPIILGSDFYGGYSSILIVKYDSTMQNNGIVEFAPAVPSRPGMRLAPNPARNWTSITQSLSDAAPAIVSLLGVDGRMVRTQRFDGQTDAPSRLDLTGLPSGVYIVRLDAAGRHATQRLVVLR